MKLTITGLNLDIVWKDKNGNFTRIERELNDIQTDVLLLPEMFGTGFCMEADEIADRNEETLQWMKSFAQTKNAAVCGSVSIEDHGQYFNRLYFVEPSGAFHYYDKRHLFSYSGEEKIYSSGDSRVIVKYKGFRILLQICYDLRFPVFCRNSDDYDAIFFVANWPSSRIDAWQTLLKARAIENQAYVFGLNRIGTDGNGLNYPESSSCFFADGTQISESDGNIVSADLILDQLNIFRKKFPFLSDRDKFNLL